MILTSVHNLEKGFAGRTLFRDVSFGIDDRDRVGLVGPNGAGKSTLLRLLAGEAEPDAGSVSRKRGLKIGVLAQVPEFAPGDTIFSAINTHADAESTVYRLLSQLDLNRFGGDFQVEQLSGGWKKRVALGRELAREPELLLLDEPTNHLDVSAILWLEEFLSSAPFALLMVTHDRLFLQRVVNHVLDLDPRNPHYLLDVRGGYVDYLDAKEHELAALKRQEKVLKNTARREREWLGHSAQARQTKQKARIQTAEALIDTVGELTQKNRAASVDLAFGENERNPKKLIEAKGLSKTFGERTLFEGVDLMITPKTRLALLGDNGCGKSTLVRILLGLEETDVGTIDRAEALNVAYFEQNRETVDPTKSVMQNICPEGDYVNFRGEFVHVRSYLDRFLFSGSKVDMPAAKLSGGEQARLRLAQLMLQPAQVLVLDEPTNDLDAETLDVLESALAEFGGAVILVTHDRYFMDAVATEILAFPPHGGPLQKFASYLQWEAWFAEEGQRAREAPKPKATAGPAKPTKVSFKDKFEFEKMEETILKLEGQIEALGVEAGNPDTDHRRLGEIRDEMATIQDQIDTKYARWAELEAMIKPAK